MPISANAAPFETFGITDFGRSATKFFLYYVICDCSYYMDWCPG